MPLRVVTTALELSTIIQQHSVVILDFGATWCGPCKAIKPHLEKLAADFPTVPILYLDVDKIEKAIKDNFVRGGIPLLIAVKGKEVVYRGEGADPKHFTALRSLLAQ